MNKITLTGTVATLMGIVLLIVLSFAAQIPKNALGLPPTMSVVKTATSSPVTTSSGHPDQFCAYGQTNSGNTGNATSDAFDCGFRLLRLYPAGTANSAKTMPATTTLVYNSSDADSVFLNILMVGSSTPSTLTTRVEYSNDQATWFGEGFTNGFTSPASVNLGNASTSVFAISTTTAEYSWMPGTFQLNNNTPGRTATSTISIPLSKPQGMFTRLTFYIKSTSTPTAGGDALAFYAEVVKKQDSGR